MPPARHSELIAIDTDQDIFVEVDGCGPYMILAHGLGASSNVFQPLLELFEAHFTVVRIDWPGHGRSPTPTGGEMPFSVPAAVSQLTAVMDHLSIASAVLVGHSFGGIISMHIAATEPDRVSSLVVIGAGRTRAPEGSPGREATLRLASRARTYGVFAMVDELVALNIPRSSPALARALMRQFTASTSSEGYAQMCEALTNVSHRDPDYAKITCPTSIVCSTQDVIAPLETALELKALIGQSGITPKLTVLDCGHMQIIEDVEGVADAINLIVKDI